MRLFAALAAACAACPVAIAAPRRPRQLQPTRPAPLAAPAAPRALQASLPAPPDGCEVPTDCQQVNATPSDLCGVQLQSGVCYVVQQQLYDLSGLSCTLEGPTTGVPAVFVAAAGAQSATLGQSTWSTNVTGRIQLTGVRLVSSDLTVTAAQLSVCMLAATSASCANKGGGIYANKLAISSRSNVSVTRACSTTGGGGVYAETSVSVTDGSWLYIGNTNSSTTGGGLWTPALAVDSAASLSIQATTAGGGGGGFYATGSVSLGNGASIAVMDANATGSGGGFHATQLVMRAGSRLEVLNTKASSDGGGLSVGTASVDQSAVFVARTTCGTGNGGGLKATQVQVTNGSSLTVSDARAANAEGGGLYATSQLLVSSGAAVRIFGGIASRCGGFFASTIQVANASSLIVKSSTADHWGGGFCGDRLTVSQGSTLKVGDTYAHITGAAFALWSALAEDGFLLDSGSTAEIYDAISTMGFACYIQSVLQVEDNSSLSISGYSDSGNKQGDFGPAGASYVGMQLSLANDANMTVEWETLGDVLVVDGGTELTGQSTLSILGQPTAATNGLKTPILHLLEGSTLDVEGFTGDSALRVGPAHEWWQLTQNATLLVDSTSLVRITESTAAVALLSLNITLLTDMEKAVATLRETNLSHVRVANCSGQMAKVTGTGTAGVADVTLSLNSTCPAGSSCPTDMFHFPDSVHIHELTVECEGWESGCEFLLAAQRMQVVSGSEHATCSKEAVMVNSKTRQCRCAAGWDQGVYPPSVDSPADKSSSEYCTTCPVNSQYDSDKHICGKCPWYLPWSKGQSFPCLPWPGEGQGDQFLRMFLPVAALAVLTLWMAVLVSSPLHITDMTWTKHDDLTAHKRSTCCWQALSKAAVRVHIMSSEPYDEGVLVLTAQGPLVEMHGIRTFLWRFLRYRVEGSGAWGVDYQPDKRNLYMLQAHGDRTIRLVGPGATLNRASSQGRLVVQHWRLALAAAVLALAIVILGPTWAAVVHYDPGHRVGHVFVSILYMVVMWALLVCVVFPLWLRIHERYYCRTPLAELHQTYRRTIRPEPYDGPDPKHPQFAGITAGVLFHTFNHYKSVVLDRTMHYVVGNIVLPLTKPRQISFATMWGGRAVMYFVSHSWGTVHSEFVKTICNHAQGVSGDAWQANTYWICSFSNNQWDISAALGETVMDSAFARVLRGGIARGVVMVLDAEVQPLTRVWCLFEVLVSHSENLKIQYATAVGVIGDPRCTSVDVPLAIASRVKALRVAECESSSAEDKRKILEEVMARMGSLEAMDKHIGGLMAASISAGFVHTQHAVTQIVGELGGTAMNKSLAGASEAVTAWAGP